MSPVQLLLLAVASMVVLGALRLVRVHLGRTPLPDGKLKLPFILGFLFVPPVALAALIGPTTASGTLDGAASVSLYVVLLVGITILTWAVAVVARMVAPRRSAPLVLALTGSQGDPDALPFDPPVTAQLAECVALVDKTNAAFPRGLEFPAQADRAGFRADWDALEAATATLEDRITAARKLGLGVASVVAATAKDARGRLETLRGFAVLKGHSWTTI